MRLESKENEKTRSSPHISGVMVSHRNMVSPQMMSPQNGVTRSGPPLLPTPSLRHCAHGLSRLMDKHRSLYWS